MIKWIAVLLCLLVLVFVFHQADRSTGHETSAISDLNSDHPDPVREHVPDSDVPVSEHRLASEADVDPEHQTISLDGQNHTGLFLDGFTSLESKFIHLENTARDHPENAFLAAEMLLKCRIHSMPIEEIDEILTVLNGSQFHFDMIAISQECQRVVDTSLFARWELYELAARGGVEEAILKQWDYPPFNTSSGELTISYDEWRAASLARLSDLAASGNADAMIRLVREYAKQGGHFFDPEIAMSYVDQLMAIRNQLTPSQEYETTFLYEYIQRSHF